MSDRLTGSGGTGARSPEVEVLLDCCRADREGVRIPNKLDWVALGEAAEYHGLAPMLHSVVERSCPERVPEEVSRQLRFSYRESAGRNLIFTRKLLALLDAFEGEGIAVVPLKGPVLAEMLYTDPVLRPFSDLDLLVRKQDVGAALGVLTREGYRLGAHLARLSVRSLLRIEFEVLLKQEQTPPVDLQWEIGLADYPFGYDPEILWRSLGRTRIAGREAACLSPESLMLFLCVHGAKHAWSRLHWVADVARLARLQTDWQGTLEFASEAGCVRPVLLGLRLAHQLAGAAVPEAILQRAGEVEAVRQLSDQVVSRLNRVPPEEPDGVELTAFNAQMAEQWWKKVRHHAGMLRAPTDEELKLVALPEWLFFLYYPLRAMRLVLKYGTRQALRCKMHQC
jgi:putative nucleotidyltransferase-like protein